MPCFAIALLILGGQLAPMSQTAAQIPSQVTSPADPVEYRVEVPAALDSLHVRACRQSGGFSLLAPSAQAKALLTEVVAQGDASVAISNERLQVTGGRGATCVVYRIDPTSTLPRAGWPRRSVTLVDAVLVSPSQFLWLPEGQSELSLEFVLPRDYRVSAPWQTISETERGRVFRVPVAFERDDARVALGRLEIYRLAEAASVIELAVLPAEPAVDSAMVRRWLSANIAAVTAIHGDFPVPRLQLLVVPLGAGGEPVPWGQVSRDGGDAVHLYIDQRQSEAAFMDDWVASHELSHLLHPALTGGARWLFEGLASYYQNVSRARVGMLTPRAAWQRLHAGFERGRHGTKLGRTLMDATRAMHAERAYMQVYWSGAAFFILADLELRSASTRAQTLDGVLAEFADCCLPARRVWTAREFLTRLDRLSGTDVFTRLAVAHRDSDRFPDLSDAYRTLGLKRLAGGRLAFDDLPRARALRNAIMGAP